MVYVSDFTFVSLAQFLAAVAPIVSLTITNQSTDLCISQVLNSGNMCEMAIYMSNKHKSLQFDGAHFDSLR